MPLTAGGRRGARLAQAQAHPAYAAPLPRVRELMETEDGTDWAVWEQAGTQLGPDEWSPDNVAPIVAYLASERSGWITGRVITLGTRRSGWPDSVTAAPWAGPGRAHR